jgi:hypothetical protein
MFLLGALTRSGWFLPLLLYISTSDHKVPINGPLALVFFYLCGYDHVVLSAIFLRALYVRGSYTLVLFVV